MAFCYECLSDYDRSIHYYGEAYRIYGRGYQLVGRARCYTKVENWDRARFDCEKVMDDNANASDHDTLGDAFYCRGLSFQNMGKQKRAISDYKMSADYGNENAMPELKKLGVYYSPKKPPKALSPSVWLARAIFVVFAAILFKYGLSVTGVNSGGIVLVILLIIPFWFLCRAWNNTKGKVHPLKKKILGSISLGIVLFSFIYIPYLQNSDGLGGGDVDINKPAVTLADNVKIYSQPNHFTDPIETIKNKGEEVTVLSKKVKGNYEQATVKYVEAEYNGTKGYIDVSYLVKTSKKEKVSAKLEKKERKKNGRQADETRKRCNGTHKRRNDAKCNRYSNGKNYRDLRFTCFLK